MTHKRTPAPRERTTLALRGTVSRVEAQLDFPTQLGIAYAREWLKAGPGSMGVDPLASGVIRRALVVYLQHLGRPELEPQHEARAVRSCCSSLAPDQEDQEGAYQRLQGRDRGQPLPPWPDVLHGPGRATDVASIDAKAAALFNEIATSNWGRLKRLKPLTTEHDE